MIRGLNGEIIPSGKTKRTLEETFLATTTLPSWMELRGNGVGTPSYNVYGAHNNRHGFLEVRTGAAEGSSAVLSFLPNGVNMYWQKEIIIELDSLYFSASNDNLEFYLQVVNSDSSNGFTLNAYRSGVVFSARSGGKISNTLLKHYPITDMWEHQRRRNIRLSVRADGTVTLLEGDIVVAQKKYSTDDLTVKTLLFPKVVVKTLSSAVEHMRFSRASISLIHN